MNNDPVSPIHPKANPVLWGFLLPLLANIGVRYGFTVDESTLDQITAAVYAVVAFYIRHRVTPVHSDGTKVQVKRP